MNTTAESLFMLGIVWMIHAAAGGVPAIFAWLDNLSGRWRALSISLLVIPFVSLMSAQHVWPVGCAVSFIWRLGLLTIVVLSVETILVLPSVRKGPTWIRLFMFIVAVVAVVPIQLIVPAVPD